jgi:hypothetical protein
MHYYLLSERFQEYNYILLLAHEEKLDGEELIEKILSKWEESKVERERLKTQMWDEREQLFGVRKEPFYAVTKKKKGTVRELLDWKMKWRELLPTCKEEIVIAARLAGFKVLFPTASVHCGWGIEDFFEHGGKEFRIEDYL